MIERTSKTSKIAAVILVSVNLIAAAFSMLFIAIGLWIIASRSTLRTAIEATGSVTLRALLPEHVLSVHLGIGLVGVATFLLFISIMGLYGAFNRSLFLLFMYSILVLLLLLLECALLYYFRSTFVEKGIQEHDGQWTHALRLVFHCCEHNTSVKILEYPWSCCGPGAYPDNCTSIYIFNKNCQETVTNWMNTNQTSIYATLAATHVILASCSLLRRCS